MKQAQTPSSSEHQQVISFLRKRDDEAAARHSAASSTRNRKSELGQKGQREYNSRRLPRERSARSEDPYVRKAPAPPLLTKVSGPDEPPRYEGKPRPIEDPNRKRRVPTLCADSYGQPFLRYSKPHPPGMDIMVRQKRQGWIEKIEMVADVKERLAPLAVLEDQWDGLIARQLHEEGLPKTGYTQTDISESFVWSTMLVKLWTEWRLERTWEDWTARGAAMQDLVEQERALAKAQGLASDGDRSGQVAPGRENPMRVEDIMKQARRQDDSNSPRKGLQKNESPQSKSPMPEEAVKQAQKQDEPKPPRNAIQKNVSVHFKSPMPALEAAHAVVEQLKADGEDTDARPGDPCSTPIWPGLVAKMESRLKWWATEATREKLKGSPSHN